MLLRKTTNLKKSKKGNRNGKEKTKKKEKKYAPTGNGTFTENIVYKEILTP